jgi:hypothetical protein
MTFELAKVPRISPTNPNPAILIPWQEVEGWNIKTIKAWLDQEGHQYIAPPVPQMHRAGDHYIVLKAFMDGLWWQFMVNDATARVRNQVLYRRPQLFPYYARLQRGAERLRRSPHFICQVCQCIRPGPQMRLVQCGKDQHEAMDYELGARCRDPKNKVLHRTREAGWFVRLLA